MHLQGYTATEQGVGVGVSVVPKSLGESSPKHFVLYPSTNAVFCGYAVPALNLEFKHSVV